MANQPIRVLFRFHAGVTFRQATEEEMAQSLEHIRQSLRKWKSSGVKLLGTFGGYGESVDGFAHYLILEVDDIDMVGKMNNDILHGEGSRFYQRHSFVIGQPSPTEGMWESS